VRSTHSWGRLKFGLEVPHPLVTAVYSKRPFDLGCCLWNKGIRHEVDEATAVCGREEGRTHLVLSDRDPWDYVVCLVLAEIMSDVRVKGTHDFATTTGM
jgi:hypothetical protein